jgi:hypothetical protein
MSIKLGTVEYAIGLRVDEESLILLFKDKGNGGFYL